MTINDAVRLLGDQTAEYRRGRQLLSAQRNQRRRARTTSGLTAGVDIAQRRTDAGQPRLISQCRIDWSQEAIQSGRLMAGERGIQFAERYRQGAGRV